jgi:hypothetical protein
LFLTDNFDYRRTVGMKKVILALAGIFLLAPLALADTIVLRDGRTLRGTVLGFMNGRVVVRIESSTTASAQAGAADSGEVRFFRPAEIERIEIDGRSLDEARFETRTVEVALGPNWIDSGVDVRRGQRVQVRASGTINAGRTRITPDGLRTTDPTAPLPRAAEGVLIGAVGTDADSPVVELGLSREFVADRDGRLYLTANRGTYTDARGSYIVRVQTERQMPQRRRDTAGNNRSDDDDDFYDPLGPDRRPSPAPVRSRTPAGGGSDPFGGGGPSRAPRQAVITVPGTSRGTDTGIDLRSGDRLVIAATGRVVAGQRAGEVGPEGGRSTGFGSIVSARPFPNAGVGALIGYIRLDNGQASQPFFVGANLTATAPADGRLILLVNDDNYSDNGGGFEVRITVN